MQKHPSLAKYSANYVRRREGLIIIEYLDFFFFDCSQIVRLFGQQQSVNQWDISDLKKTFHDPEEHLAC